jgi:hypothetical protein
MGDVIMKDLTPAVWQCGVSPVDLNRFKITKRERENAYDKTIQEHYREWQHCEI